MKKYIKLKEVEFRILGIINVCKILDRIKEQDTKKMLKIMLYFNILIIHIHCHLE